MLLLMALIIGLALRLIRLGFPALSNLEAESALQALAIARGWEPVFGDQIAYAGMTGILFYMFSPINFLARFWPAIFGTLVILIPFVFRKTIGLWPASIASLLLAFTPEMVSLSRIIGSPMSAVVFLLLAVGLVIQMKPILAGICLGLGLMSGTGFWVGALIIAVSYFLSDRLFGVRGVFSEQTESVHRPVWIRFALSFSVTILVVGTGFFLAPAGLSGVFSGLYAFILGLGQVGSKPFGIIPFALLAYGSGALIFGLWGGIRGILIRSRLDRFLLIWAAIGLVSIMLYPRGGPADVIWVTFPLWVLASRVLVSAWRTPENSRLIVGITTTLVVVVFAFMFLALRTLVSPYLLQAQQINYFIALVGGVVLVVAIVLLVSYGWSEGIARVGFLLGLALVFSAMMISISVNSSGLGSEIPYELWYPDEAVLLPEWMQVTIERTLVWNARRGAPLEIAAAGIDTPGLRWALQQYDPVDFVPFVPPQLDPGIIITPVDAIPEISQAYQGQRLVWIRYVPWRELSPSQYLTWLITRDVPTIPQEVILWVRTDLMPGGQLTE